MYNCIHEFFKSLKTDYMKPFFDRTCKNCRKELIMSEKQDSVEFEELTEEMKEELANGKGDDEDEQ